MTIPVKFTKETITVNVYFGKLGNGDNCTLVFPIERAIIKTEAVARAAIEELINGPTEEEKNDGYFSGVNQNSKINKLTIANETAMIDFNNSLEEGVGGSCRVAGIREQIIKTLMQFPTVKKVIISIDGRTEDILQP
jgi:spore germination protein GerM